MLENKKHNKIPTHKGGVYLFPHTHTHKTERTFKIKTRKREKKNTGKKQKR